MTVTPLNVTGDPVCAEANLPLTRPLCPAHTLTADLNPGLIKSHSVL